MKNKCCYILICVIFLLEINVYSQHATSYRTEIFGSVANGNNTPFWMLYQNYGMVPFSENNFYIRQGVFHEQKVSERWFLNGGIDIAGSSPHAYGTIWVQQLFGEVDWRFLKFRIGSKEEYTSFLDPLLSSGDFSYSNNSRPIPEIKLSVPDFVLIPGSKGNFYMKGDFAIGKYMDSDFLENKAFPHQKNYVKGVLSHHKSIYFKFGNIENGHKFQFICGLDHQAQWGGTLYKINTKGEYIKTEQPHGFTDFLRVMIAKEGSDDFSKADSEYAAGSHVGAYIFKLDYKLDPSKKLMLYRHHFFDDGSGMAFENYKDMLLGVQYKNENHSFVKGAVFEYIYTKNQTGPIHFNSEMDEAHGNIRNKGNGNDNYYNNRDYIQGRSYYGRTMGTPLFLSNEFNNDGMLNFKCNRIIAFHLGVEGDLRKDLNYRILITNGRGWGTNYEPFVKVKTGNAGLIDLKYRAKLAGNISFKLTFAFNRGDFFGDNSTGCGLTVIKKGFF